MARRSYGVGGRAAKKSQGRALLRREDAVIDWLQEGGGGTTGERVL